METINLEVQNECEKKEIGKQEQKNAQQFQNYSVKSLISIDDFKHKSMVSSTVKQVRENYKKIKKKFFFE